MSTASVVPETRDLSGEDAWATLRRVGRRRLVTDAFVRLRVADGFSHARSLAFMTSLGVMQAIIGAVGLAGVAGGTGFGDVVSATLRRVIPGPAGQALTPAVAHAQATGSQHHMAAVCFGVIGCLVTATTAFGQIERGLNRIYGVEQDRPSVQKYGLGALLALTAGTLGAFAFVSLAAGRNLFRTVSAGRVSTVWNATRWPLGLLLIGGAITLLLRTCPRRRQPRLSWLALGSGIGVGLWALVTAGLGVFFHLSRSFGQTYGPLAGIVALMLWSLLSSIALLYGSSVAAQLEAVRQGSAEPQDAEKVAESAPEGDRAEMSVAGSSR